jgi:hypothetical protein
MIETINDPLGSPVAHGACPKGLTSCRARLVGWKPQDCTGLTE